MSSLLTYLKRIFSPNPATSVAPVTLDEDSLIRSVSADMARLEYLATWHHNNYLAQWRVYSADIGAPHGESVFTRLEEQNGLLQQKYESVRCGIIRQMKRYDNFCADTGRLYSDEWNKLLHDLGPYQSGISCLGSKKAA
jgi:hypothetical protein